MPKTDTLTTACIVGAIVEINGYTQQKAHEIIERLLESEDLLGIKESTRILAPQSISTFNKMQRQFLLFRKKWHIWTMRCRNG